MHHLKCRRRDCVSRAPPSYVCRLQTCAAVKRAQPSSDERKRDRSVLARASEWPTRKERIPRPRFLPRQRIHRGSDCMPPCGPGTRLESRVCVRRSGSFARSTSTSPSRYLPPPEPAGSRPERRNGKAIGLRLQPNRDANRIEYAAPGVLVLRPAKGLEADATRFLHQTEPTNTTGRTLEPLFSVDCQ